MFAILSCKRTDLQAVYALYQLLCSSAYFNCSVRTMRFGTHHSCNDLNLKLDMKFQLKLKTNLNTE